MARRPERSPEFPISIACVLSPLSFAAADVGYASETTVKPPPRFFVAQFPTGFDVSSTAS